MHTIHKASNVSPRVPAPRATTDVHTNAFAHDLQTRCELFSVLFRSLCGALAVILRKKKKRDQTARPHIRLYHGTSTVFIMSWFKQLLPLSNQPPWMLELRSSEYFIVATITLSMFTVLFLSFDIVHDGFWLIVVLHRISFSMPWYARISYPIHSAPRISFEFLIDHTPDRPRHANCLGRTSGSGI